MIVDLFPVKIYKTQYQGDLDSIVDNLYNIIDFESVKSNNQGSMRGEGVCTYVDRRDLHTLPEFEEIKLFIEHHAAIYWKDIGYDAYFKPKVIEMWCNIYKSDSFIDLHNHAPRVMTSSFYLCKKSGIGNIVYENPLSTLLKHQPYHIDKNTYHTLFEQQIDGESGDLIIFPGWLNHKTLPNQGQDRVMIGTNICAEPSNQN
jgi:uncharacterized protein (TIGR02466 family)